MYHLLMKFMVSSELEYEQLVINALQVMSGIFIYYIHFKELYLILVPSAAPQPLSVSDGML